MISETRVFVKLLRRDFCTAAVCREISMKIQTDLCGSHIRIRNYRESDLGFLTDMWFDEENGKYLSDPTREYVDDKFQKALDTLGESETGYYLVIVLADTGERVGSCCMFPDETGKIYDIGYCIHKRFWGKGYGGEALSLMLDWMETQGAGKVTAEVSVGNVPSNRLLGKFGFVVERRTKFQKYHMDISFDSFIYGKELVLESALN